MNDALQSVEGERVEVREPADPKTATETDNEVIARLAKMKPLDYDRVRKDEAESLGIQVTTLDKAVKAARVNVQVDGLKPREIEPWSEPVDGVALLDEIVSEIRRYVVLSDDDAAAAALWVLHTHVYECWRITPRLAILAPEKRSGKSTLLDVLHELVARPVKSENTSNAVLFRLIDQYQPTVLLDEVDKWLRSDHEAGPALNAGCKRGGQHLRCEGDDFKIRAFKTFAPVALAGIGKLEGTLADRSITIDMKRRRPDEIVEDFDEELAHKLHELARKAACWTADARGDLTAARPDIPKALFNRDKQNWLPLLTIAEVAGGSWPEIARRIAVQAVESDVEPDSYRTLLLADIRDIFNGQDHDRIFSKTLCERLVGLEERPWGEFQKGKPITQNKVARLLRSFGIKSAGTIRIADETLNGYARSQFIDAWNRYLPDPPDSTITPSQVKETAAFRPNATITPNFDVMVGNRPKPTDSKGCDGVMVRIAPSREDDL